MEPKTKSKRKKHPEQFKLEAVRVLETRGERTVADVAASLGVSESLLHSWKKKYGSAAAQLRKERGGETPEEELKRLRREMTQVKQERDILKKSIALTAREPLRAGPVGEGAIPGRRALRSRGCVTQRLLRVVEEHTVEAPGGQ
jgi:transposase